MLTLLLTLVAGVLRAKALAWDEVLTTCGACETADDFEGA